VLLDGIDAGRAALGLADHAEETGIGQQLFGELVHARGGGGAGRADCFALDRIDRRYLSTIIDIFAGGPAGLTAATYLARFRRSVLVADSGKPRACWIPVSHNMPGFPEGIGGEAIVARMVEQATEYGAVIEAGRVESLTRDREGWAARLNGRTVRARAVILAAGVVDRQPRLAGVADAVERSLVRICPICDAYEATGAAIAVIGDDDKGLREAAFLRTYSDRVTLIHVGPAEALTERAALE
jgi:thioredoxin reductase (NADPH)